MTNNQKNHLVYSCLENIIPIKKLYDCFLTVAECSNNATIDKSLVHPLQQEIIKEYQRVDELERSMRKSPSALELCVERLSLQMKTLKESYEDYENGRSWTELDEDKIRVLEEVSHKTFPLIYTALNKEMEDFKENPKQKAMSQRESWPKLL
jgi:predicted  nucleic acid-binding Zn-ribbon protein